MTVHGEGKIIHRPARAYVGHCPTCGDVVIFTNNYESWPAFRCECGTAVTTANLENRHRYERGKVIDP